MTGVTGTTSLLVNDQTGTTYTLQLTDKDLLVRCSNVANITVTVDTNTNIPFPLGSVITIEKYGTGNVKISPTGGVTINSFNSCNTIDFQYTAASLVKTATNTWWLSGSLILT